jgi:hypothetical protein
MSKRIDAKLAAYSKLAIVFEDNKALFNSFLPLKEQIKLFNDLLADLMTKRTIFQDKTVGITDTKEAIKKEMVDLCLVLAKKMYVWAKKNKQTAIISDLDLVATDFNVSYLNCVKLARTVESHLEKHIDQLADYRISKKDLSKFKAAIDALGDNLPQTAHKRGESKAVKIALRDKIKEQDDILDDIFNLVESEYGLSHPELITRMFVTRQIDDPARRRTILLVEVQDDKKQALSNVLCDIEEMQDEEQYTDSDGKAWIRGIRSGNYTLHLSHDDYQSRKISFKIDRGQKLKLNITLHQETVNH